MVSAFNFSLFLVKKEVKQIPLLYVFIEQRACMVFVSFLIVICCFCFGQEEEVKPIKHLVRSHVRDAALLSNVGAEISFQLPNDASASFEGMLKEIDNRKNELKISG